jgi:uncharacterized NAD(P)/FAD-binding protein YdhS
VNSPKPTIAIVGGGFSGAAVAYHLACAQVHASVLVFEPRARVGGGLAYGCDEPVYRVNVPATRMSLLPDDDTHFARWLASSGVIAQDPDALSGDDAFPRRQDFGRYVDQALGPFLAEGSVRHLRDAVVSVRRVSDAWLVRTTTGHETFADLIIVATTHPGPALPTELRGLGDDPRLVADPLADGALNRISDGERVLLVGSGLTAADIVAKLDARGHRGRIVMISRRGLRSLGHPSRSLPPEGDFIAEPARSATELLGAVRRAVRRATAAGRTWHPVFDAARAQGEGIWRALTPDARRRVVRHLRPFWDIHRFRIAPQIDAVLERKLADGSLELRKARLGAGEADAAGVSIDLRDVRRSATTRETFDRIVLATGPAHGDILRLQPYLSELADDGFVALDAMGLGLHTSRKGRAIGVSGRSEPTLFIAGPLARGTFGELMGLPQVSNYALFIAEEARAELSEELVQSNAAASVAGE